MVATEESDSVFPHVLDGESTENDIARTHGYAYVFIVVRVDRTTSTVVEHIALGCPRSNDIERAVLAFCPDNRSYRKIFPPRGGTKDGSNLSSFELEGYLI